MFRLCLRLLACRIFGRITHLVGDPQFIEHLEKPSHRPGCFDPDDDRTRQARSMRGPLAFVLQRLLADLSRSHDPTWRSSAGSHGSHRRLGNPGAIHVEGQHYPEALVADLYQAQKEKRGPFFQTRSRALLSRR
jgi:hypothetical protein